MMRMLTRLIQQGFSDLTLNPLTQLFTLAAVVLVAFLSGLFLMALTTLNHQLGTTRGETAFQVFWRPQSDMALVRNQWTDFQYMPGFASVKTYTPEEALKELGVRMGRNEPAEKAFPFLAVKNPLPATALVFFSPREVDIEAWILETTKYFGNLPGVERVVATPLRDELGQAWRKISRYVMLPAVIFLSLILGLVVGNTIRLSLVARAHEIGILQMIGAYNWYIRLPLVVGGAAQGFVGGTLALAMLQFMHSQIKDVLNFSPIFMEIRFLPWELSLALVLVPTCMGILASWLAVRN